MKYLAKKTDWKRYTIDMERQKPQTVSCETLSGALLSAVKQEITARKTN